MDIKTIYDADTGTFDWQLVNGQLVMDDGLETSVILSTFTDRRSEDSDVLPNGGDDRRGWWGDAFPEIPGDVLGSRLWLLSRTKDIPATLEQSLTVSITRPDRTRTDIRFANLWESL
jgi:phage gp46-like protein